MTPSFEENIPQSNNTCRIFKTAWSSSEKGNNQYRCIDVNCALQNNRIMATKIKEVIHYLESWAPPGLQESYDNSGLIVGNKDNGVKGVLVALDCTEAVVDEAQRLNCNLIVAHHPIVFGGLKRLTGSNYVQRTVIKAIQNDIAIYAIHTNLDNIATGVNAAMGEVLGVESSKILRPMHQKIWSLTVYVPFDHLEMVEKALFDAGAGAIGNYVECSFKMAGKGAFKPTANANPVLGSAGVREFIDEFKLEVMVPDWRRSWVQQAMELAHPYEVVAHQWTLIDNAHQEVGAGMVGELSEAMPILEFMQGVKDRFQLKMIKHTELYHEKVSKVAWCGGSGDFLLEDAIRSGAQVFVSADFKYHRFFDHESKIVILDIGHYETEKCVIDLLNVAIGQKFTTFAVHKTGVNTNPVQYF